ncbi:MAG: 8-amino-7-oxononanoate synthase [Nitrospira sp.]|nr:8-amino-7-oxononanoate synthase [Nitrospira sp.]MDH4369524.1 8-amino-7-oxononanoate synthase [Nitrospira sp.]MDH5496046.1 8-amino-7-oxononanoate synthase [Nitrospira sp.]MDH5724457.1 8-amino-7-oxononanoate synthase [Nitrospira sp.]
MSHMVGINVFREKLQQLSARSLLRTLAPLESATGASVHYGGRDVILLSSNDYLGLSNHPEVVRAAMMATERYGVGSGAARLVSGTLPPHTHLETTLARFKGTEAALLFGAGYVANLGIIPTLIGSGGRILVDRLCHASVIDACRLSQADFRVFRHGDCNHVESLLRRRATDCPTLIITEGVFSMDGDLAPLPDLVSLAERYGAMMYVDDAHGTGIMGANGRGTVEHFGLERRIPFHMGTLSKAIGGHGAFLVGPNDLVQYMINVARPFIFATALPPAVAAASSAALAVIDQEPERRARLWSNRQRFFDGLKNLGLCLTPTDSPILPVLIGDAAAASTFAERLLALGVYATAIRPPTVPDGTSRIRFTVTSEHTTDQIDEALNALRIAIRETGLV